ncbi:MAG: hypothetical protein ABFS19_01545 [Thermodesulfobacteriota bacterium]
MSIKLLALELYRAKQKVTDLEQLLAEAPPAELQSIEEELRIVRSEHDMIQKMFDSKKTSGAEQLLEHRLKYGKFKI